MIGSAFRLIKGAYVLLHTGIRNADRRIVRPPSAASWLAKDLHDLIDAEARRLLPWREILEDATNCCTYACAGTNINARWSVQS